MKALIKYPGSKWRIAKDIVNLIPEHHSYLEPYFGSGAILFNKRPSNIETINDMDSEVFNLFRCIQQDEKELAKMVALTPFSRDAYNWAFEYDETENKYIKASKFMIRCCMGHGFRTTGERVGWKNDVIGRESAYALRSWCNVPSLVLECAERLKRVQIDNLSALDVIKRFNYENVFMYLDPPYLLETRKSNKGQYKHEMTYEDHKELLELIKKSKAKIMISGYDSDLYNEMLHDWKKEIMMSNDNSGRRTAEVIWMNYEPQLKLF